MQLVAPIHVVVFMMMYYASLVFIGYVFFQFIYKKTGKYLFVPLAKVPLFGRGLIYLATVFTVMAIFTVTAYAFKLPILAGGIFYIGLIVVSLIYFWRDLRVDFIAHLKMNVASWTRTPLFSAAGIMITLLIFDFIANIFIGGYLGGDGLIHISKIRYLINHGFTLTDAYYGTVPETRHHLSVLHTIYAIPGAFGISALNAWFYSLAPMKLALISAKFFLAWRILKSFKLRDSLATSLASSITILAIFGGYFTTVPGTFVVTWVALLAIGLLDLVSVRKSGIVIMACILIAMTHSLIAIATILLLGLIVCLQLIFRRSSLSKPVIRTYAISMLILITTPIVSLLLPNRMTAEAHDYNLAKYNFTHLFGLKAFTPDLNQYTGQTLLIFACVALIGIASVWLYTKSRSERIIITALLLYIPLTLYNPVFVYASGHFLPAWGQARLATVNVLSHIALGVGIYAVVRFALNRVNGGKARRHISKVVFFACLASALLTQTFNTVDVSAGKRDLMYNQIGTYGSLTRMSELLIPAKAESVVFAERYYDNFMIPDISDLRVVAISEGNSTPAADMERRTPCYEMTQKTLGYDLLAQLHVRYVMAQRGSPMHQLASSLPYLKLINGNESHELFEVTHMKRNTANVPICQFRE